MPKQFYTEKDIEDLYSNGTRSLQVTDQVVLTELAYEKAKQLGVQLLTGGAEIPPAAPVRPYLSDAQPARPGPVTAAPVQTVTQSQAPVTPAPSHRENGPDLEKRIRSAVIARLGNQVDAKLLDTIIHRVVKGIGLK